MASNYAIRSLCATCEATQLTRYSDTALFNKPAASQVALKQGIPRPQPASSVGLMAAGLWVQRRRAGAYIQAAVDGVQRRGRQQLCRIQPRRRLRLVRDFLDQRRRPRFF